MLVYSPHGYSTLTLRVRAGLREGGAIKRRGRRQGSSGYGFSGSFDAAAGRSGYLSREDWTQAPRRLCAAPRRPNADTWYQRSNNRERNQTRDHRRPV